MLFELGLLGCLSCCIVTFQQLTSRLKVVQLGLVDLVNSPQVKVALVVLNISNGCFICWV